MTEALEEQLESAKREIGALHILMAGIIGDGNTAYIKKSVIATGGKALRMSDDEENFIIEVVDVPSEVKADVV